MSDIVLGIDLGTTNSVVSVADGTDVRVLMDEGGSRLIPSVVSFHPDGRVLVGIEARERRLVDAPNTVYSVKRLIGRPFRSGEVAEAQKRFAFKLKESANGGVLVAIRNDTFTLTEISAFVLAEVKRIAELAIGKSVTKAVITVPAAFNELQRSATKAAGRVAGLEVLRIVNEPTAAALAYGIGRQQKERVAVFDFGGGTFDLTLLELENDVFEVLGSAGDSFLGGDDVDTLIADVMADAFLREHRWDVREHEQAYERFRAAAEWLKCELTSKDVATASVEDVTYGPKGAAIHLSHTMSRAELDKLISPLVTRALGVCVQALAEAKLTAADLDAVILVGGSTRIPLVRKAVRDFFVLDARANIDPDLVVAQGAAIHGYSITGRKPEKAVGRVALKRMTVQEIEATQKKRAAARAAGPKQQAFATNAEAPVVAPAPKPAPRPAVVVTKPAVAIRPAVAIAPKPAVAVTPRVAIGKAKGAALPLPEVPAPTGAKLPGLPQPKLRLSTLPPAPMRSIPVPDLGSGPAALELDDAFGVGGKVIKQPVAAPGFGVGPSSPFGLDGAFASPSPIVQDAMALDTAVRRASARPPPMGSFVPPVSGTGPSATGGGSGLLTLDDFDTYGNAPTHTPAPKPVVAMAPTVSIVGQRANPIPPPPPGDDEIDELDADVLEPSLTLAPPISPFFAPASGPVADDMPDFPDALPAPTPNAPEPAFFDPPPSTVIVMPAQKAPILMDVTPLSLGVETVGGFCQSVIRRNVPIPCEQTRSFTTAADRQTAVTIRVCQGESRKVAENQLLGAVELTGLRSAARGDVKIAVTFEIDASGILDVKAVDETTGEAQSTRIRLLGGADEAEIESMRLRQQALTGVRS